jgi:chromosome segregation ATPase
MADDTGTPDPAAAAPSNESSTPAAPATDNSSADVEQAKKAAEQATMRANQLENELKKIRDNQSEAERKQLEEKEEFKALYEKNEAELKQIRETREAEERQRTLQSETETVFKDYPANVAELAKTAGLSLIDDSEAARSALKEKLEAIKTQIGSAGTPAVNPNNPAAPAAANPDRAKLVENMALAGAQGDDKPTRAFIRSLPQINEMKRQAGLPVEENA